MGDNLEHPPNADHSHMTSRASGNYAFLNHSAITLPNNLPPNIDDKLLARQKRKRTSQEDQATLEAAYNRDPKPDKVARLELVKTVALGEKEVQIWFQNRRQSSRRKSRPLLPHEIAQYQLSRSGMSSDPLSVEPTSSSEPASETHQPPRIMEQASQVDLENGSFTREPELPSSSDSAEERYVTSTATDPVEAPAAMASAASDPTQVAKEIPKAPRPATTKPCMGYLANRRSFPTLRTGQDISSEHHRSTDGNSVPRLRKTSSVVRLSMTSEGNAQVITKDSSSPSPPRVPPTIQLSVDDGHQVLPQSSVLSNQASNPPATNRVQRSSSGRSRDSRAWEFWCDKDSRGELEDKAEKDASGSAAVAIDLLRSTSGRNILGVIPSKRNSYLTRHASFLKRSRVDAKPASLQRSTTSFGRLQGKPASEMKSTPKTKPLESAVAVYIPGNDSDKENWSPDTDVPSDGHIAVEVQSARQRLSAHPSLPKSYKSLSNSENNDPEADPEADPEVAAFMRGSRKSTSISEEEDMDCVQGLLSLSQGNWR